MGFKNLSNMEYFIVLVLQLLGISFHVMQKIISLGDKHPEKTRAQIFSVFMYEDWDALIVSGLVLLTDLVFHLIVGEYFPGAREWSTTGTLWNMQFTLTYYVITFLVAFVLGYAGQRLAYKYLGSAENMLSKKAEELKEIEKK